MRGDLDVLPEWKRRTYTVRAINTLVAVFCVILLWLVLFKGEGSGLIYKFLWKLLTIIFWMGLGVVFWRFLRKR